MDSPTQVTAGRVADSEDGRGSESVPRGGVPSAGLLRAPHGKSRLGQQVTSVELFFDLMFVFAVTQLSQLLLEHLTPRGAAQAVLLLVAVWRSWIDTAWITNWFDPLRRPVWALLVGVMLVSLLMSAALPQAFGEGEGRREG